MAFEFINKAGCKSTEGFTVQVISRFEIQYSEGIKKITIPYQPGKRGNEYIAIMDKSDFNRWDDGTVNSNTELTMRRVEEATKFLGVPAKFN